MQLTALVAGGTGRVGVPVTCRLLARHHRARVMTRGGHSADIPAGAEQVRGDFDDPDSLVRAMRDVDVVIATGTAHRAGPQGEARHGANLVSAAARAGIAHLVYISGAGADAPTGIPVLESKRSVEAHIHDAGVPATILAPAYFMENAFNPWNLPALRDSTFPLALPRSRALAQVAIDDVAAFAVLAAEQRGRFLGRRIELASDQLTGPQAAERLSRVTGHRFEHVQGELPPPLRPLFAWLASRGFGIDVQRLHATYPEVPWQTFEQWASRQVWP